MAKLVEIAARKIVEFPEGFQRLSQRSDGLIVAAAGYGYTREVAIFDIAEDRDTAVVTRPQWKAERARIAANQQATLEARDIAQGEELPKRDSKLWKRAALAAFAGYCARPGMDAECAAEEAMFAADAFMNAMEKHLSSN